MDKILKEAEGNRRYFKLLVTQSFMTMCAIAFNCFAYSFYTAVPHYECLVDGEYQPVTEVKAGENLAICKPPTYKFPSWIQTYDMTGDRIGERNHAVAISLLLNTFVVYILSILADKFGRQIITFFLTTGILIGTTLIYTVDSYHFKGIMLGLTTGLDGIYSNLFTIQGKESSQRRSSTNSLIVSILLIGYAIGTISVGVSTYFIPNSDLLALCGMMVIILGATGNFFIIKEPPMFLYKAKNKKGLKKSISFIAKMNGVNFSEYDIDRKIESLFQEPVDVDSENEDFDSNNEDNENQNAESKGKITKNEHEELYAIPNFEISKDQDEFNKSKQSDSSKMLKVFFSWKYISATIALATQASGLLLMFYGGNFSIDRAGIDDLRISQILLGLSSLTGYSLSIPIMRITKRKLGSLLGYSIMVISTVALFFVTQTLGQSDLSKILQTCISIGILNTLVAIAFSILYVYASEVYPIAIRSIGMGTIIFIGNMIASSAPYVISYMDELGIHPMIGCALPAIPAIILTIIWLPETKQSSNKKILTE